VVSDHDLVGIERSGPTQGDYFKKEKNFWVRRKNSDPNFLIFAKKNFRFRELGSCRLEFRARDPTIPEFFKNRKRSHVGSIGPSAATCCSGECLLVKVKLACRSTEAKGRL
jgi:hypothetical protein